MKLYEIIKHSASIALAFQNSNGEMPPGHNGPWNDPETPVRNTGHWLITFIKAYEISGSHIFLNAANRAADYLSSTEARPMGKAFWHRKNPNKDLTNGLIGQAWSMEALAIGSTQLRRPELAKLAEDLFLQHPFDYSTGLWASINMDGTAGKPDQTLNHQIWFAASGSLLIGQAGVSKEVTNRTLKSIDHLHKYIRFDTQGIINHIFKNPLSSGNPWHIRLKQILCPKHQKSFTNVLGIGYHSFNLYGLALLKQMHSSHSIWASSQLLPMWKPINSGQFNELTQNNPYSYLYNPSGIEIAFALHLFRPNSTALIEQYLTDQFSKSFNFKTGLMEGRGASDPITLSARLYEATRLPDYPIQL